MASPARINIFNPWRVWILITVLNAGLFTGAAVTLNSVAASENARLSSIQLEILVKSRFKNLDDGDFRSLSSGLGKDESALYVKASDGLSDITLGNKTQSGHCSETEVPLIKTKPDGTPRIVRVELCRPFESPVAGVAVVGGLFLLISAAGVLAAFRLDRNVTRRLLAFFHNHGVEVSQSEGLSGVLDRIDDLNRALKDAKKSEVNAATAKALAELAEQVAHDIRSPIAALTNEVENLTKFIPEERQQILKGATARISAIAESLLATNRLERKPAVTSCHLYTLVSEVVREKQVEFQFEKAISISFDYVAPQATCLIDRAEFQRVISNLINNAVNACRQKEIDNQIRVSATIVGSKAEIFIVDDGPGIPEFILKRIAERGISSSQNGNGLGLFHAKETMTALGGTIDIGNGDTGGAYVKISLPAVVTYTNSEQCVLVDDDVFVRDAWEQAFASSGRSLLTFGSFHDLKPSLPALPANTPIFLDSEISTEERGEEIASRLQILGFSELYLATGYDAARFGELSFLKGVIGKDPPRWLLC